MNIKCTCCPIKNFEQRLDQTLLSQQQTKFISQNNQVPLNLQTSMASGVWVILSFQTVSLLIQSTSLPTYEAIIESFIAHIAFGIQSVQPFKFAPVQLRFQMSLKLQQAHLKPWSLLCFQKTAVLQQYLKLYYNQKNSLCFLLYFAYPSYIGQ